MINQKGGVGKSSTTFHMAGTLAERGYAVLLVDADPQGSLSQAFLGSAAVEQLPPQQTLAALFEESLPRVSLHQLAIDTGIDGIAIVPANHHLAPFNMPRPATAGFRQYLLRDLLESCSRQRVVLIDCPPNLYQCSWNAMLAASHVMIPVPPEDFGTQGLRAIHQAIQQAQLLNSGLRRLGHLVTRYDRRLLLHRSYAERLQTLYPQLVLQTRIPEAVAFKMAVTSRLPIAQYAATSKAADAMQALVAELEQRIAGKMPSPAGTIEDQPQPEKAIEESG